MIARLSIFFIFAAASAAAQDSPFIANSGERPVIRPDGTYVFNHQPNADKTTSKPFEVIFEAQIAPRIIIKDSIGKATSQLFDKKAPVWGWQASATPMVRLRMFNQISDPVRTPSYMPKGTIQIARFASGYSESGNDRRVSMWLIDVIPFGHHSNGQDGCLFTSQIRDGENCIDQPGLPRMVNKHDGSFSTNYIEANVFFGRLHLGPRKAAGELVTNFEWRAGLLTQFNPKGYVGGSIDDELAPLYGQTRVGTEVMAAWRNVGYFGRIETGGRLQYLVNTPAGLHPVIVSIQLTALPRQWGGAGGFARYYVGQDYYNLGFAENISRVEFGFALQQASFLSFKLAGLGQRP